jgi:phosphoribosylaminoimidazolecarboxamide formyltransferase/IMP cyclohydrolase
MNIKPKRALVSVYDKDGLADFCRQMVDAGITIFATTGTRNYLQQHGIPVCDSETYTGFSELLGGRVKTLHTNIHAALLARPEEFGHLASEGVEPLDMVVCNFYPYSLGIGDMDIGGPAMVRAAAKNWRRVVVVSHPCQYEKLAFGLVAGFDDETRRMLAAEALRCTSYYDAMLVWHANDRPFPDVACLPYVKKMDLRYGENPHQRGAFYVEEGVTEPCIATAEQLQGKALSYNNILDAHHAISCVREFEQPATVIVKHATPSGIACAEEFEQTWKDAFATDVYSPFGGVVAVNREVTPPLAAAMTDIFLEVVIAPSFADEALALFSKKKNLRLLKLPDIGNTQRAAALELRSVGSGLLVQDADVLPIDSRTWRTVTKAKPTEDDIASMAFALKCVRHVKSNSVVFVKGTRTVGIGGGQTARVDASWIAVHKGKENIPGSIMASDAFFPFRDAVDVAAEAGVRAIVQPGGSIRDDEVVRAADEHGIVMVMTGQRYFLH